MSCSPRCINFCAREIRLAIRAATLVCPAEAAFAWRASAFESQEFAFASLAWRRWLRARALVQSGAAAPGAAVDVDGARTGEPADAADAAPAAPAAPKVRAPLRAPPRPGT